MKTGKVKVGDICPICETGKLEENYKDVHFTCLGNTLILTNEKIYSCSLCDEGVFFDPKRNTAILSAFIEHRQKVMELNRHIYGNSVDEVYEYDNRQSDKKQGQEKEKESLDAIDKELDESPYFIVKNGK